MSLRMDRLACEPVYAESRTLLFQPIHSMPSNYLLSLQLRFQMTSESVTRFNGAGMGVGSSDVITAGTKPSTRTPPRRPSRNNCRQRYSCERETSCFSAVADTWRLTGKALFNDPKLRLVGEPTPSACGDDLKSAHCPKTVLIPVPGRGNLT